MSRWWLLALAASALLLCFMVCSPLGGTGSRAQRESKAVGASAKPAAVPSLSPTRARKDSQPAPLRLVGADGRDPAAAFLKSSQYPPSSRPLRESSVDLIEWNRRYERPWPVGDGGLELLLTADKASVVGDEVVTVFLEASRNGSPTTVPIRHAYLKTATSAEHSFALEWSEGRATAELDLRSVAGGKPSLVEVVVQVEVNGTRREQRVRVHVTPTPPASFGDLLSSPVRAGSLDAVVEVDVERAGFYLFDANLWDADGKPVAWARWRGDLAHGSHKVPITFAGNAVLSRSPTLPMELRQLRGARRVPGQSPDLERLEAVENVGVVTLESTSELSSAPHDSEKKRATLRALRAMSGLPPS